MPIDTSARGQEAPSPTVLQVCTVPDIFIHHPLHPTRVFCECGCACVCERVVSPRVLYSAAADVSQNDLDLGGGNHDDNPLGYIKEARGKEKGERDEKKKGKKGQERKRKETKKKRKKRKHWKKKTLEKGNTEKRKH